MSEWAASDSSPSEPVRTTTTALAAVRPADATMEDSATFCLTSRMRAFAPSYSYSFQLEPAACPLRAVRSTRVHGMLHVTSRVGRWVRDVLPNVRSDNEALPR